MENYIIVGGAGFIGSHIVESLVKKKKKVSVIDNLSTGRIENIKPFLKKIDFVKADISKNGKWKKKIKRNSIIIHLAALADIVPSIDDPEKYFKANVIGTFNLLQACKNNKILKFLYAASSSCYGIPKKFPTPEDAKIDLQYPYALTKKIGEDIVMHWSKVFRIPAISLRLFNVYGTRSRTSGTYGAMFGVFLAQKANQKPFTIVGDGKQTRDFTYVDDVVEAFLKASRSKIKNNIFNVGSGKTVSVNKIVKILKGKKTYIPKRPGEPDCTFADISKIKSHLKWIPKIDITTGVKKLFKDIKYWKTAPVWTPKKIKKATSLWFKFLS